MKLTRPWLIAFASLACAHFVSADSVGESSLIQPLLDRDQQASDVEVSAVDQRLMPSHLVAGLGAVMGKVADTVHSGARGCVRVAEREWKCATTPYPRAPQLANLRQACFGGNVDEFERIMRTCPGARQLVKAERPLGHYYLLFYAADKGHDEVVKLLLRHRADPNHRGPYSRMHGPEHDTTALVLAVSNSHLSTVKLLLQHGAKASERVLKYAIDHHVHLMVYDRDERFYAAEQIVGLLRDAVAA